MSRYISAALRKRVAIRANFRCEYCRLPEIVVLVKFQVDHIIAIQHGGKTIFLNLANICPICNGNKGPNVGTVFPGKEDVFVPFFNPRKHNWHDHFEIRSGEIFPKTLIAAGTIKILAFNKPERVLERKALQDAGFYP